jgi:uncharacterized membrane protein
MKLVVVFVAGLLVGGAICSIYIASLKATIKLHRFYIHERIGRRWNQNQTATGQVHLDHTHAA